MKRVKRVESGERSEKHDITPFWRVGVWGSHCGLSRYSEKYLRMKSTKINQRDRRGIGKECTGIQ